MGCKAEAPHEHVVQFYDHDHELAACVGPYLAETIQVGGVAIVIATEAHRQAFAARLAGAGISPDLARAGLTPAGPALVMLDAREAADTLLIDGQIAPHRFEKLIGHLVREAAVGGRPIRAYGEIVSVLWSEGHVQAAMDLEELWNGLGREIEFSLYCAYPVTQVGAEDDPDAFREVCRLHSAVVGEPAIPRPEQDPQLEIEATFQWSGRSPGRARRFVSETLTAWDRAELVDDAVLVATELATNAILHAGTEFAVTLSRGHDCTIRVAVHDTSAVRPRPRWAGTLDSSGRGLRLIEAIAIRWGADLHPGGKVVWAELQGTRPDGFRRPGAAITAG